LFVNNSNLVTSKNKLSKDIKQSSKISKKFNIFSYKNFSIEKAAYTNINQNNLNDVTQIDEFKIKLILPNFIKPIIKINKNSTFKELSLLIKKHFNFENIEFKTSDHSIISLGNDLKSCLESGNLIFMRIDNFEWQLLNYNLITKEYCDIFSEGNF